MGGGGANSLTAKIFLRTHVKRASTGSSENSFAVVAWARIIAKGEYRYFLRKKTIFNRKFG
jgi:vacuolar-type H+-ATPase subunit B/Vma2